MMPKVASLLQICHPSEDSCCQKHENNAADLQISFLALLLKRLHSSHRAAVPSTYVCVVTQHDVIDLRLMGGA